MTIYSLFSTPVLSMQALTHALGTVSNNIANLSTGGYKGVETRFQTLVDDGGNTGVQAVDFNTISKQGNIVSSGRDLDVAIAGAGFFVLNTEQDGSGDTLYTRDGGFAIARGPDITVTGLNGLPITTSESYLVDKNGYYVQGWLPDNNGLFTNSGSLTSLRVDSNAFTNAGQASTTAELRLNLPAGTSTGDAETYAAFLIDSAVNDQSVTLTFTKAPTLGQWSISVSTGNIGDVVISTPQNITFDSDGQLTGPGIYTVSVNWAGGGTSNVALDISGLTQLAGPFLPFGYDQNGFRASSMTDFSFNSIGEVIGNFDDSTFRALYKMPLAIFINPNGLSARFGNTYEVGENSGSAQLVAADDSGFGAFAPNSHELSNVDLATEFTRMIAIQHAYNASSMAFKTADEMTKTTSELIT